VPDTTIESAKYNGNVADVAADLNAARPIVAGGTGGTSAAAARANLQAEVGAQLVTNYDTHVFEAGSFYSLSGATGAPVAADLGGTCLIIEKGATDDIIIYAYELLSGVFWGRGKAGGAWGPWVNHTVRNDGLYVNTTGDTMTGQLTNAGTYPGFILNMTGAAPTTSAALLSKHGGVNRWVIAMGDETANQDFTIAGWDNSAVPRNGIRIDRATAGVNIENGLRVTNVTIGTGFFWSPSVAQSIFFKPLDAAVGMIQMFQNSTAGVVGSISHTASQAGVTYNTTSDERLKQHREELVQADARSIIDALRVYDYDKDGNEIRGIGLVAQQAYGVHKSLATPPPAHAKEGEDVWMLEKAAPVAFLIANVQQLNARIDELEALLAQFKPPEKPA
jgi:hypothetical protein